MYRIIGSDHLEYGPITKEQLIQWVREGRVNGQTLVKAEGETEWKPLSSFQELEDSLRVGSALPPAILPIAQSAEELEETILNRVVTVNIGSCISRSWQIVKNNFWLTVGTTFLVFLASWMISAIPLLGYLLGFILNEVLFGGLYWFFLKLIRGEETEVGDAFGGFRLAFIQLMLAGVIMGLLTMIAILIVCLPFFLPIFLDLIKFMGSLHGSGPSEVTALIAKFGILCVLGILAGMIVSIFLSIIWLFTLPLVVDKKLDFWQAMRLSRKVAMKIWFRLFGLMLVCGLIGIAGVLALLVGIFVALPISFCAIAYAYEDIFGNQNRQTAGSNHSLGMSNQ